MDAGRVHISLENPTGIAACSSALGAARPRGQGQVSATKSKEVSPDGIPSPRPGLVLGSFFFALQNPNGASKAEKLGGKRDLCEGSGCKGEFGGNEHEKGMIALKDRQEKVWGQVWRNAWDGQDRGTFLWTVILRAAERS